MIGRQTKLLAIALSAAILLVGCGGEQGQIAKQESPQTEAPATTAAETTTAETARGEITAMETTVAEGRVPEDTMGVLALQYEHINAGDFENAYSLFAEQSQQQVSLEQYRAFFEANAPYSVTDYSLSPAQGDAAAVQTTFTVNSAAGTERLQRTQRFVREEGEWRVVMRPEQVAAFTTTGNAVDCQEQSPTAARPSPPPSPVNGDAGGNKSSATESSETQTVTIRVTGAPEMPFSGNYGTLNGQRSVDGNTRPTLRRRWKPGSSHSTPWSLSCRREDRATES